MYPPVSRSGYRKPANNLLSTLDNISAPRLGGFLLVLAAALVLFIWQAHNSAEPRRIANTGVPGSIYQINGAPQPPANPVEQPQGPAQLTVPQPFANILIAPRHITSEFGHYPNGQPHYGLDLDAWYGEVQYAPVGGIVIEVKRGCVEGDTTCGKGWGNHVWFKSAEDGKYVLLAHFQKIYDDIQENVQFSAGHPIGETGATGYASGPHVHLQVNPDGMQNAGSENPAWEFPWLRCGEPTLGNFFGSACK